MPTPIEIPTQHNGTRGPNNDAPKTQMEPPSATAKIESTRQHSERAPTPLSASSQKKEGSVKPADEAEVQKVIPPLVVAPITTQQVTTTKSGRASKPSTPAVGSFPDNPTSNSINNNNNNNGRSRPSRGSETPAVPKRSHKKGASAAHAVAVQKAIAQSKADDDSNSVHEDEHDGVDPNEETYCYCNQVSYGQMVGCDGEDCKREWFHLGCVGLKVAPGKNGKSSTPPLLCRNGKSARLTLALVKWYCDDCKKHMAAPGKKVNGR